MSSYGEYKRQRESSDHGRSRDSYGDRDRSRDSYGDRDRSRDSYGDRDRRDSYGDRSRRGPPPAKRGRGGPAFQRSDPSEPRIGSEVQIFVQGLPKNIRESELEEYFGTVGEIKEDKLTKKKRIWIYKESDGKTQKGECTITYRNTETQSEAIRKYNGQYYQGQKIEVTPSIVRPHMAKPPPPGRGRGGGRGRGRGGFGRGRGGSGGRGGGGSNANYEAIGDRRGFGGSSSRSSFGGDRRDSYGSGHDRRDSYGSSSRYGYR